MDQWRNFLRTKQKEKSDRFKRPYTHVGKVYHAACMCLCSARVLHSARVCCRRCATCECLSVGILFRVGGRVPEGSRSAPLFPHPPTRGEEQSWRGRSPSTSKGRWTGFCRSAERRSIPQRQEKKRTRTCSESAHGQRCVCTWSVSVRHVRTTDGTRGVARPISNIDGFVKHVYREHDQEDDHWANIDAQSRRK